MEDTFKVDIFIGNIGLKSLTLSGRYAERYKEIPGSRHVRNSVVIDFDDEDKMLSFLQKIIDEGVPALHSHRQEVDRDVKYFMELGKITGKPYVYDLLLNKVVLMENFSPEITDQ
jgi:hypothetical protein